MINAIIKSNNGNYVNTNNTTSYYADERYYYLVNNFIDKQLKQNSKLTFSNNTLFPYLTDKFITLSIINHLLHYTVKHLFFKEKEDN